MTENSGTNLAAISPRVSPLFGLSADMRPSVFIIDPDTAARDAIVNMLRGAGLRARAFSSGQSFLDRMPTDLVACVVTEMRLRHEDVDVIQEVLNQRGDAWAIIVITSGIDVARAVGMMKAGVVDVVEKPFEPERLLETVRDNVDRLREERPRIEAREQNARNIGLLTARERQVFDALTAGRSNKEIAGDLEISPRTVEIFRAKVMAKMEAPSLSALVRMSIDLS